jgi:hypothetical protein
LTPLHIHHLCDQSHCDRSHHPLLRLQYNSRHKLNRILRRGTTPRGHAKGSSGSCFTTTDDGVEDVSEIAIRDVLEEEADVEGLLPSSSGKSSI